jgi:AAA domain-containing protein
VRRKIRRAFPLAAGTNRMRRAARHLRIHWPDYLLSIFGFGADEITVSEAATANQRLFQTFGLRTLHQIVQQQYPATAPIVEHFLSPGETGLLIARQKEGKSTLALQLAVDVSRGESFLGRYRTQQALVLYVDYENRPSRLKERATDIGQGRSLDQVIYLAFDAISDRSVALFGDKFETLEYIVEELSPGLLVIDPLRFAIEKDSSDERAAVDALDQVSKLRANNPKLAVLLVHHLKKAQDNFTPELRNDPRAWIERVYGSQALLAHVETIWGLEHDEAGYAFGTVSRSEDSFVLALEKEPESQRFRISDTPVQVAGMTPALQEAWGRLPQEFSRSEGVALGIPNNTLDRLIRHAQPVGLLVQDGNTRRYRKVG